MLVSPCSQSCRCRDEVALSSSIALLALSSNIALPPLSKTGCITSEGGPPRLVECPKYVIQNPEGTPPKPIRIKTSQWSVVPNTFMDQ